MDPKYRIKELDLQVALSHNVFGSSESSEIEKTNKKVKIILVREESIQLNFNAFWFHMLKQCSVDETTKSSISSSFSENEHMAEQKMIRLQPDLKIKAEPFRHIPSSKRQETSPECQTWKFSKLLPWEFADRTQWIQIWPRRYKRIAGGRKLLRQCHYILNPKNSEPKDWQKKRVKRES